MDPWLIILFVVGVGGLLGLLMRLFAQPPRDPRVGQKLIITVGRGAGQERTIIDAFDDELTLDRPWDVAPDSNSAFTIK